MLRKIIKFIAFIIYSWSIYNFYFFTCVAIILYKGNYGFNLQSFVEIINEILDIFLFPINIFAYLLPKFFKHGIFIFSSPHDEYNDMAFFVFVLCTLYAVVIYFWSKRQTIIRAWSLAMTGLIAGPGLILFFTPIAPYRLSFGIPAFIGINLFFGLLLAGNRLQKKYYPDNRLANRIRWLLKWPCLRT